MAIFTLLTEDALQRKFARYLQIEKIFCDPGHLMKKSAKLQGIIKG